MTLIKKPLIIRVISLVVVIMFLQASFVYASGASLRIPVSSHDRQRVIALLKYMYMTEEGNHSIIVKRNNVVDSKSGELLHEGQVAMRCCELRELSDPERDAVIKSLKSWGQLGNGTIHWLEIRGICNILSYEKEKRFNTLDKRHSRVYVVLSSPKENYTDSIDVEGFIMINYLEEGDKRVSRVQVYILKPDNLEPFQRFIGVGEILYYALWRELELGQNIFFLSFDSKISHKKGFLSYDYHAYDRSEILDRIIERTGDTLKHLEYYASKGDESAINILRNVEEIQKMGVSSCI